MFETGTIIEYYFDKCIKFGDNTETIQYDGENVEEYARLNAPKGAYGFKILKRGMKDLPIMHYLEEK